MSHVTHPTQPGEMRAKADAFRSLFERSLVGGPPAETFDAWEVCGPVRRGKPAVDVAHVVRPTLYTPGRDTNLNPVWSRLLELAERGDVTRGRYWVEPDSRVVECVHLGRLHRLHLATRDSWGMQLVRHTGPEGFWEMTVARLKAAGTLTLHDGHVQHVDRSAAALRMTIVECPTEDDYLRAARTKYLPPGRRYAPPPGAWAAGMLRPWLPEFLTPYVDPGTDPWLLPIGFTQPAGRKTRAAAGRHNQRSPDHAQSRTRDDVARARPAHPGPPAAAPGPQRADRPC